MTWVSNARECWTHYSTQGLALATTVGGVWTAIPDDIKATYPHSVSKTIGYLILVFCIYGLIGKFVDQTPKGDKDANIPS